MSLAQRESRADFPEMSLQLLDPSAWELVACGASFREENNIILEAHSILYAVRYAKSKFPAGRLLILSDNFALVLALCKGHSNNFTLPSVMCWIFGSSFGAGLVFSFRWIPSELNYSDKGSRLFDRDNDQVKSLLYVLAQRLLRLPLAQTGDK